MERHQPQDHNTPSSSEAGACLWEDQIQDLTGLFIVSTPIGHRQDITLRALATLRHVDGILCEDTRQTRILLDFYQIHTPCYSFHAHNEHAKLQGVVARLQQGARLAMVSDRGTPLLSDPGLSLVDACYRCGLPVHVIPGPSAITAAAVLSGFSCVPFVFQGFLPTKSRRKVLAALVDIPATLIFFLAPHGLARDLADLQEVLGPRPACLLREMTKKFQERIPGTLPDLITWAEHAPHVGECVLVVGPPPRLDRVHKNKYSREGAPD